MEKEPPTCSTCGLFAAGECILHKIEVCYNDESCKDYVESITDKNNENKNSNQIYMGETLI